LNLFWEFIFFIFFLFLGEGWIARFGGPVIKEGNPEKEEHATKLSVNFSYT